MKGSSLTECTIAVISASLIGLPLLGALLVSVLRSQQRGAALASAAVGTAFAVSIMVLGASVWQAPATGPLFRLDRLSALMLVLVTGVSTIVHAFAVRYMDSDPRYARFFCWLSIVTASVIVMVTANSLILLALGWLGVSLALYELQTHFRGRPAAKAAARLMRATHAVGDVAMIAACVILGLATGSGRIDVALGQAGTLGHAALGIAVALLAVAAFSKSAQLPLHRWLPETMEAPTPVSALMHAGIVNAGGYLLARFSPLVVHARPLAVAIFIIGAATALWGGSCMLVRSDVKRGLAYSTVSQMGYMIMQCGLGAFPAAILHLFAHGIFKATLFLGSGYAIHDYKRELRAPACAVVFVRNRWAGAAVAALAVPVAVLVAFTSLGRSLPPYGWVLLAFATFTCMQAAFAIVKRGTLGEALAALGLIGAALPAYAALLIWFDRFLAADVDAAALLVAPWLVVLTLALFATVLILGWSVFRIPPPVRDRVYVWLLSERLPLRALRA